MSSVDIFESAYDNVDIGGTNQQQDPVLEPQLSTSSWESNGSEWNHSSGLSVKIKDQERRDDEYIVYIIEIHATTPEMQARFGGLSTWTVARRYSEFDLLKTNLEVTHPSCLIPPLPGKVTSYLPWKYAGQKNDAEFIEARRVRLEQFLHRLVHHPRLGELDLVTQFLCEGDSWKQNVKTKALTEKVSDFVVCRSASMRIRESCPVVGQLRDRATRVHACIDRVLAIRRRTLQHSYGMHKLHKNYGEALADWCAHQPNMADQLQTMGHLMDSFSGLMEAGEEEEMEFETQIQDYLKYCESLLDLCRRHDTTTLAMEQEADRLQLRRRQLQDIEEGKSSLTLKGLKSKLMGSGAGMDRMEVMEELRNDITVSEESLHALQEQVAQFTDAVQRELDHFEKEKRTDLASTMQAYASLQLQRSKRSLRVWTQCRQSLSTIPDMEKK